MNVKYIYWSFKNVIPHRICDYMIKYYNQKKEQERVAFVRGTDKGDADKKIRNSNIIWTEELWMSRYIMPYIKMANKNANWNFQLDNPEPFQLTKYSVGGHYDWHCDSWEEPYKEGKFEKQPWFESMPTEIFNVLKKNLGWHLLITAKLKEN